jgi:hypothetical protein
VALDGNAAAAIAQALSLWARVAPAALDATAIQSPLSPVAVVSAYVAVQQFAQRSAHAMDALEAQEQAQAKEWWWRHSVHLVPEIVPGYWGTFAGIAEGYAAIAVDMDGTWDDPADRGLVFDRTDAAALALTAVAPPGESDIRAVSEQATAAFDRTAATLGEREAPRSPETDWMAPVEDLGIDFHGERMNHERGWGGRLRLPR